MSIVSIIALAFTGILFIFKSSISNLDGLSRWWLLAVLLVKITMGAALYEFYLQAEKRIDADIFKYYDDGCTLASMDWDKFNHLMINHGVGDEKLEKEIFEINHWQSSQSQSTLQDNRFLIRVNALLALIGGYQYGFNALFFILLAFIGLVLLLKTLDLSGITIRPWHLLILALSPTIICWTSGIFKESIITFCIGLATYTWSNWSHKKPLNILLLAASLRILSVLSPYLAAAAIPIGIVTYGKKKNWKKSILATVVVCCTLFLITISYLGFDQMKKTVNNRIDDFVQLATENEAGSLIKLDRLESFSDLFTNSVKAINNVLLRPNILEVKNAFYIPFAIENIGLFFIFLWITSRCIRYQNLSETAILLAIIVIAIIIGLSTPVLGATIRYRAPIVLILYSSLFYYSNPQIHKP